MKDSGVIGEGSHSFPIVKEFEAKKRGIRCDVYCKLLKLTHIHDINHLFNYSQVRTKHNTTSLWKKPLEAAAVIQEWESRLAFLRS